MTAASKTPSPLEAMAKAYWNATTDQYNKWDTLDDVEMAVQINAQRAALRALAEVELPEEVRATGCAQLVLSDEVRTDLWDDMGDAFEAMLHSIASEGE